MQTQALIVISSNSGNLIETNQSECKVVKNRENVSNYKVSTS